MEINQSNVQALFRLLLKFHIETDCGKVSHWQECMSAFDILESLDQERAAGLSEWLRDHNRIVI